MDRSRPARTGRLRGWEQRPERRRAVPTKKPPPPFFQFVLEALAISRDVIRSSPFPPPQKAAALSILQINSKEALIKILEELRGRVGDYEGEILKGEQAPILDRDLFDAVQAKLNEQINNHTARKVRSEALLTGKIFDDHGNRMSPSHARKAGIKYRYYLSSALLKGTADRVGSVHRVPADEVERLIVKSVREHLSLTQEIDDRTLVDSRIARIQMQSGEIVVQLADAQEIKANSEKAKDVSALQAATTLHRLCEIIESVDGPLVQCLRAQIQRHAPSG